MRFMKPIMAITAICAGMLMMRMAMMHSKQSGMRKRRGMMRRGR
jgi:hypothetical protein